MTAILSTIRCSDGYDLRTDYRPEAFHSLVERADWPAWVAEQISLLEEAAMPESLASVKATKSAAIDARTEDLLDAGFSFGGKQFTLARLSQTVWLGLAIGAQSGMLSYPISVGALDNTMLVLADASAVGAFAATALLRGQEIVEGGATLRAAVAACETLEAVAAVEDSR